MPIPPRAPSKELVLRPRAEVALRAPDEAPRPLSPKEWMDALLRKPFPELADKLDRNGYDIRTSQTKQAGGEAYWSITPSPRPESRVLHAFFGANGEPPPGGIFLKEFLERWADRSDQHDHHRLTQSSVTAKIETERGRDADYARRTQEQVDQLVDDGFSPGAAQEKVAQARAQRELEETVRRLGSYLGKSIVDAESGKPAMLTVHTSEQLARAILTGKLPGPVADAVQMGQYRIEQTHIDQPQGRIFVDPSRKLVRLEQGHGQDLSQVTLHSA